MQVPKHNDFISISGRNGKIHTLLRKYRGRGAKLSWSPGGGTEPPPITGTIIVDDVDTGFVKGGTASGWRTTSEGYSEDYVSLSDVTLEAYRTRLIGFDAIKWLPK